MCFTKNDNVWDIVLSQQAPVRRNLRNTISVPNRKPLEEKYKREEKWICTQCDFVNNYGMYTFCTSCYKTREPDAKILKVGEDTKALRHGDLGREELPEKERERRPFEGGKEERKAGSIRSTHNNFWKCPKCGRDNLKTSSQCYSCSTPQFGREYSKPKSPPSAVSPSIKHPQLNITGKKMGYYCNKCKTESKYSICQRCSSRAQFHYDLNLPVSKEKKRYLCQKCVEFTEYSICPTCKRDLHNNIGETSSKIKHEKRTTVPRYHNY